MRHIKFKVSPYPITIHVCSLDYPIQKKVHIDPDLAEFDKTNLAETMMARSKKGNAHVVIMRLPEKYDEETVWHESIHAAAFLLETVGASFCADSMDTVIYPTEYIVRKTKQLFYPTPKPPND